MGGFSTIVGVEREALVSYAGVTDADGAADGTSLKCSAIGSGSGYPDFDGNQVIITSGPYKGQARYINGPTNADAAGTITVANAFDGQIPSGTSFIITGIRTVPAEVAALQEDIGDFSAQTNLKSLLAVLGSGWDTENKTVYDKLVTDGVVVNSRTSAYKRLAGVPQVIEVPVTSAANAGDVTIATITDQPCVIDSIIIHANTAQTSDLTSCAVYGGAGKVVTFISDTDATQANLDAADKQVSWTGAVRLAAGKTIVMSLVGTGSTAVDLTVTITYHAVADGGYLA